MSIRTEYIYILYVTHIYNYLDKNNFEGNISNIPTHPECSDIIEYILYMILLSTDFT